jgi:hypothetical protein
MIDCYRGCVADIFYFVIYSYFFLDRFRRLQSNPIEATLTEQLIVGAIRQMTSGPTSFTRNMNQLSSRPRMLN